MTLPFKAVAVDMDGTFLNGERTYDKELFNKVLTQLEERNVHFIVASGRPYARLKDDFIDFSDRMDFVTANGSRLMSDDKEIGITTMKRETVLSLIEEVHAKYGKMATILFAPNMAYVGADAPKRDKDFLRYFAGNSTEVKDWNTLPDAPFIELTFHYDRKFAPQIEREFNRKYGNLVSVFGSAKKAIDVNAYGVSKGKGLKEMLTKFGLTGDDLIAFGDGGNDIPMLDLAKYSYAMENGMTEVKNHARFIAPKNTENGVLRVLQEYLNKD
ncbi:Cof-type HAD-IIB family hydrolase [Lactobacillus sp.]|uniref:Cof-type HAD-IIB family hydrolase n=1 Tax=Lactobacillus sp. TaxID=1591 RepID=UPI00198741E5|nr:Cof-type HAD-IIB family hydrolase [Lactobacillus sp.]MBD5429927.1 HAD family hydrolase [Lactobacillus sp.]